MHVLDFSAPMPHRMSSTCHFGAVAICGRSHTALRRCAPHQQYVHAAGAKCSNARASAAMMPSVTPGHAPQRLPVAGTRKSRTSRKTTLRSRCTLAAATSRTPTVSRGRRSSSVRRRSARDGGRARHRQPASRHRDGRSTPPRRGRRNREALDCDEVHNGVD